MVARGRRPHHRDVHSLTELLIPDEIVLDTSFVYAALQPGQTWHRECATFLERAATNETSFFFNRLLEIELREVAFRGAFERRWGTQWRRQRYDGRTRGSAARQAAETMDAWDALLSGNAFARIELDEVEGFVDELMALGLGSYDAVHVATATFAEVSDFVTLDASFALVPNLTLHVDPSRVNRCRQTRGGHANR